MNNTKRARVQLGNFEKTLTKQSFKKDTDVNNIIERFTKTGLMTHVNNLKAAYGDFSQELDFHQAQNILTSAEQSFMALPSKLRNRFDNDPQQLLDFISDENNLEEATKLGLISSDRYNALMEAKNTTRKESSPSSKQGEAAVEKSEKTEK